MIRSLSIFIVLSFSFICDSRDVILVFAMITSFSRYSSCMDSEQAGEVFDRLLAGWRDLRWVKVATGVGRGGLVAVV